MKSEKRIVGKVQSIDIFNKRIDNLIAMRGTGGWDRYVIYDDAYDDENGDGGYNVTISLYTNGATAYLTAYIRAFEDKHYSYELPKNFRPVSDIIVYRDGNSYFAVAKGDGEYEMPRIEGHLFPKIDDNGDVVPHEFSFVYPIYDISVAELEDARVGYDGTVHETVGTAIREQIKSASAGTVRVAFDGMDAATLDSMEIYDAYTNGKMPYFEYGGELFMPASITNEMATFQATMVVDKQPILAIASIDPAGSISMEVTPLGGGSENLGDIEEALDRIIEIQNALIGGGAV